MGRIKLLGVMVGLLASVLLAQSCKKLMCYTVNGPIRQWSYLIAPFDKVRVFNGPQMYITQTDSQSVIMESEENMFQALLFHIDPFEKRLFVDYNEVCVNDVGHFKIFLGLIGFTEADLIGNAELHVDDTLTTPKLTIKMQGAGSMHIEALIADTLETEISGTGVVYGQGADTVAVLNLLISGEGSQHTFGIDTKVALVNISGSGSAELTVLDTLRVTVSGSGNVYYKGDPVIETNITGTGQLINAN